jgi:hypothetical protein
MRRVSLRAFALFGVKAVHSVAFWVIQSAIFFLVYKGLKGESDRAAAGAAGIAIGETLIYVGNGFRCPLTTLAEDLGSEHGAVTDIFLPDWLASNIARIYGPMLAFAILLHARNIARRGVPASNTRGLRGRGTSRGPQVPKPLGAE